MRALRARRLLLALAAVATVSSGPLGADERPSAAKTLPYRASYGDALLEARMRNVPVFVSRHKDG